MPNDVPFGSPRGPRARAPHGQRFPPFRDVVATWRFFTDPKASLWVKLLFVLAVAYVVSPIDLIPDFVPVLGWLDDLGVIALAAGLLLRVIAPYRDLPPVTNAPPADPTPIDTQGETIE